MKVLNVKDVYPYDTLSASNDNGWKRVLAAVSEENEDVVLDFKDLLVTDPWNNRFFLSVIRGKGKVIRLYDSEDTATGIKGFSLLNNVKISVENIKSESLKVRDSVEDSRLNAAYERKINILKKVCRVENGVGYIKVFEVFENLGNVETVESIGKVIPIMFEGVKLVKVELGHATIQENMYKLLMNIVKEQKNRGVQVKIVSEDTKNKSNIQIYKDMKINIGRDEKYKILKDKLVPNMPVMISTFRRSKSLDELGREGEGKEIAINPAVIKKIIETEDREGNTVYKLVVDLYKASNFVSKLSYAWDNDGGKHPGISKITQEINIMDLGFMNEFVGRRRHVYGPVHSDRSLGIEMYVGAENGSVNKVKMAIPECMRIVFDDFGVEYDRDFLNECIERTREL